MARRIVIDTLIVLFAVFVATGSVVCMAAVTFLHLVRRRRLPTLPVQEHPACCICTRCYAWVVRSR